MKHLFTALSFPAARARGYSPDDAVGKIVPLFRPDRKFARGDAESELVVDNLNVYIKEQHILKGIHLTIPDKKITCVVGPSGCGKSTLLKTFNRLIDSIEEVRVTGRVLLNGVDIISSSGTESIHLRREMGLISQKPCPLPMSIFDNIAYGCRIHGIRGKKKLRLVVQHYLELPVYGKK